MYKDREHREAFAAFSRLVSIYVATVEYKIIFSFHAARVGYFNGFAMVIINGAVQTFSCLENKVSSRAVQFCAPISRVLQSK